MLWKHKNNLIKQKK